VGCPKLTLFARRWTPAPTCALGLFTYVIVHLRYSTLVQAFCVLQFIVSCIQLHEFSRFVFIFFVFRFTILYRFACRVQSRTGCARSDALNIGAAESQVCVGLDFEVHIFPRSCLDFVLSYSAAKLV